MLNCRKLEICEEFTFQDEPFEYLLWVLAKNQSFDRLEIPIADVGLNSLRNWFFQYLKRLDFGHECLSCYFIQRL